MTECPERSDTGALVVTVVDVDALGVDRLSRGLGSDSELVEGGVVLEADGEGDGKLAAGVDLSEQDVGKAVSELVSTEESLYQSEGGRQWIAQEAAKARATVCEGV